ncbi:MAG: RNA polymerase factor sigma-54 [Planctomycetes bacterium]|nr:RNA polymerase factor sigma-54 [Planctomycetota bacterium]
MQLALTPKLEQQTVAIPQMILSMKILQLASQDLEARIDRELQENPALEIRERGPEEAGGEPADARGEDDIFAKLQAFEALERALPRRRTAASASDRLEALENTPAPPPDLRSHLREQLCWLELDPAVEAFAREIIESVDLRGYLGTSPEEMKASIAPESARRFDEALAVVQSLDPPGVGARDLRDCLLIQLRRDRQPYPIEMGIIETHLDDLSENRLPKIAKDLGCTLEEVKDAVETIRSLSPVPGARFSSETIPHVRPDVVVEPTEKGFAVRLEDDRLPPLSVSESCRALLAQRGEDRDVVQFVRRKIEAAQWLIQAVEQRQRTLRDIAEALVVHQSGFMERGPEHLGVLTMQAIADRVGVHISTVSRAIRGKWIQTPWGVFPLRYFFTGGLDREDGSVESRRNVSREIEEIVREENKRRPYSDTDIARILCEKGLRIARRTVTKYREERGIPPSRQRRQY